jgi:hypothetical protein
MRHTLYEFLVLNKWLTLPGIGTISIRQESSQLDITNRQFTPPSFAYSLDARKDSPSKKLFEWISAALGITEWDAIKAVNDFSVSFKNELAENKLVVWEKVGSFKNDGAGNLKLDPDVSIPGEQPVIAEKVIRQKAEHTILVGEQERSSAEMEEYFADTPVKRNYTSLIAAILVVIAILFIGWYFSEKGFTPSAAGNNSVLKSK